ncbi:Peroxidase 57 [Camellia lanceoleosa]|uniref:Peroxidase 57 n=1 Tax=Camellia lanceoleosa TaxID=1840588 RepID=A0ACC0FQU4_9ERIC|nr:Peroxidase 57 [Camellia lanceoleosa]
MVTLLGAHTVGVAHRGFFQDRLSNFQGSGKPDPTMDPALVSKLFNLCGTQSRPLSQDPTAFLDQNTSFVFDNEYYHQIKLKRGVMQIDQVLALDKASAPIVTSFASNAIGFQQGFAKAIVKMGGIEVLVGNAEEIRKNCRGSLLQLQSPDAMLPLDLKCCCRLICVEGRIAVVFYHDLAVLSQIMFFLLCCQFGSASGLIFVSAIEVEGYEDGYGKLPKKNDAKVKDSIQNEVDTCADAAKSQRAEMAHKVPEVKEMLPIDHSNSIMEETMGVGSNGRYSSVNEASQEEAKATILMGKALGICFGGKEEEVIKKLKDMEVKDKEMALPRTAEALVMDAIQS